MNPPADHRTALLSLSHELGTETRALAILGEGNTSARLGDATFLVKASGSSLATLAPDDLVECWFEPLRAMLDGGEIDDVRIDEILFGCRVDPAAKKPSVEAVFHADLLSLPGVEFVGHAHPVSVNAVLCSPRAEEFAKRRLFPDEIVCCGVGSVFVPYVDPGLRLARAIHEGVKEFRHATGTLPRVILLANHGVITLGTSPQAVLAAMLMVDKAARIFAGAAALGGPQFLGEADVHRIANRADEHYRQRALRL